MRVVKKKYGVFSVIETEVFDCVRLLRKRYSFDRLNANKSECIILVF